jgi:hypothetical protein
MSEYGKVPQMPIVYTSEPSVRAPKNFRKGNLEEFLGFAKALHISPRALAEQIGYSPTAYNGWAEEGTLPLVASLAAKGLVAQAKQEAIGKEVIFLVRAANHKDTLVALFKGLNVEFTSI